MDQGMFRKCLCDHESGVRLLTRPAEIREIGQVTARGVRKVIAMSRLSFPYVVVDVGSPYDDRSTQILRQSDVILLVMRMDFSSLQQTKRLIDQHSDLSVNRSKIRLVLNRYRRTADLKPAMIEETLGVSLFQIIPDNPKVVSRANNKGIPVVLERPLSSVSRGLRKMAANVNGAP
jgi:pilus assembly protein CpaE